jgi:hypothetical protein
VQIIKLKRFGGAPHHIQFAPLRQRLPIFFIGNLQLQNRVKTKVLVHNSLRVSHSSIFILIISYIIKKY